MESPILSMYSDNPFKRTDPKKSKEETNPDKIITTTAQEKEKEDFNITTDIQRTQPINNSRTEIIILNKYPRLRNPDQINITQLPPSMYKSSQKPSSEIINMPIISIYAEDPSKGAHPIYSINKASLQIKYLFPSLLINSQQSFRH